MVPRPNQYRGQSAGAERPIQVAHDNCGEKHLPIVPCESVETPLAEVGGGNEGVLEYAKREEDDDGSVTSGSKNDALPENGIGVSLKVGQRAGTDPINLHPLIDEKRDEAADKRKQRHQRAAYNDAKAIDYVNVEKMVEEEVVCSIKGVASSYRREPTRKRRPSEDYCG